MPVTGLFILTAFLIPLNLLSGHDHFFPNTFLVICDYWHVLFGSHIPVVTTSLNRIPVKLDYRVEMRNYLHSLVGRGYFDVPEDGRISRGKFCGLEIVEEL
jgi:hypothetical protein